MLQKNEQTKKQTDEQADGAEFIGPLPYTRGPENRKKKKKNFPFSLPINPQSQCSLAFYLSNQNYLIHS